MDYLVIKNGNYERYIPIHEVEEIRVRDKRIVEYKLFNKYWNDIGTDEVAYVVDIFNIKRTKSVEKPLDIAKIKEEQSC